MSDSDRPAACHIWSRGVPYLGWGVPYLEKGWGRRRRAPIARPQGERAVEVACSARVRRNQTRGPWFETRGGRCTALVLNEPSPPLARASLEASAVAGAPKLRAVRLLQEGDCHIRE
eukprot:4268137-Prymnesium_polylepis.1